MVSLKLLVSLCLVALGYWATFCAGRDYEKFHDKTVAVIELMFAGFLIVLGLVWW